MVRLVILRILESYFRRRWLNLLPIVIMLAAAVLFIMRLEPTYIAKGTFYVQGESLLASLTQVRDSGFGWNSPAKITADEMFQLLQTEAFARAVLEQTDMRADLAADPGETMDALRQSFSAAASGDNLVSFSFEHTNAQVAYQLATAMVNTFKNWKLNNDRQESAVAQAFFAQVIEPYKTDLQRARDQLRSYLETYPDPVRGERPAEETLQIQQYEEAVAQAQERLDDAVEKEESARLSLAQAESTVNQTYVVIDAPTVPLKPETSLKQVAVYLVIFLALGMIMTVAAIIGGAILDHTYRFPSDLRQSLDLPVLAVIADTSRRRPTRKAKAPVTSPGDVQAAPSPSASAPQS